MDKYHPGWIGKLAIVSVGAIASIALHYHYYRNKLFFPSRRVTREEIVADGGIPFILNSHGDINKDRLENNKESNEKRLLEYFEFGADEKEAKHTILFIHGAMTTGKLWKIYDEFAKENRIRIISPSLPGWGLSDTMNDPLNASPLQWVDDLQQLMTHLGYHRNDNNDNNNNNGNNIFHVVGASLGSIYAAQLAASDILAATIGNVMLYVAFAPLSENIDPFNGSQLKGNYILQTNNPQFARWLQHFIIIPLMKLFLPEDSRRSISLHWEGLWNCINDACSPWHPQWQNIALHRKVFIVSGTKDDVMLPANQKFLNENIENSILISYEGGHADAIEHPKDHYRHLLRLL